MLRNTTPASIADLLAQYGLADCRARLVARLDCAVWRIASPDGQDLSLRIYAPEREDATPITTEISWLRTLANAGVYVPRPVPDTHGRFLQSWRAQAEAPAQHAVLLQWLPGRVVYKGLRPVHLQRLGELIAQLHNSSQALVSRGVLASTRLAHTVDLPGWAQGHRLLPVGYPAGLLGRVQAAAQHLQQLMARWPRDATHWGFIHGDLHFWNTVFHQAAAGAIDFTDSGWGFMAQDLAGVLQFVKHPLTPADAHLGANYLQLHDALLAGYASLRPLPQSLREQIEPLVTLRMLHTLQWMVDDWPAPDHRAWGPGFLLKLGNTLGKAFD